MQIEAGERRCARAGRDDLHLVDLLAGEGERVLDRGPHDDRGAMLVVMEHRDFHARLELVFDLEAFGRLEILQVDAAEGRLQRRDHRDHVIAIVRVDLDVEHVDAGEFLEQDRLAFHHRLAGERADVAEPENRRSVRDDGDQIGARGQLGRLRRVGDDRLAGRRDTRRIGEREIALAAERLRRLDLQLSGLRRAVVGERAGAQVIGNRRGHCHSPVPSEPTIWHLSRRQSRTVPHRGSARLPPAAPTARSPALGRASQQTFVCSAVTPRRATEFSRRAPPWTGGPWHPHSRPNQAG